MSFPIPSIVSRRWVLHLQKRRLESIKKENPTCRIESTLLNDSRLGQYVGIGQGVELTHCSVDDYSYVANDTKLELVIVGKFCSIGPQCKVGLDRHPKSFVSTHPIFHAKENESSVKMVRRNDVFDVSPKATRIWHDVWFGTNVVLPGGIEIGTGAIIAAGAVVVKDIPPYAIAGGNPARVIRYRFPESQIDDILQSRWWEWSFSEIEKNVDSFQNIEKFKEFLNSRQA